MTTERVWDLVVVGGGSAGLVASKAAARLGARVLLIEGNRLGGDCLWAGCVPSKALIATAHRVAQLRTSGAPSDRSAAFRDALAAAHAATHHIVPVDEPPALNAAGVAVAQGHARFTSAHTLDVDGVSVRFRRAVIATGTSPRVPDFPGATDVAIHTSDDVWNLTDLPARVAVLGAGAIGCELGQAFAQLGADVTLIGRGSRVLNKEDPDASAIVQRRMEVEGVSLRLGRTIASATATTPGADSGTLTLDDGSTLEFDLLVAAVGRQPHTDNLHLDLAGVAVTEAGYVQVSPTLQTTQRSIWAAGDVTGLAAHTHAAGVNGSTAATNAVLGLTRRAVSEKLVRVTFTSPEVAAIGITAEDADPRKHRVITRAHEHVDRAVTEGDTDGFTRIVVDRRGTILGGTIVSARAGETIGELALAIGAGLSTSAIASVTHPYPTYNDGLWNVAVEDIQHRLDHGAVAVGIRALRRLRTPKGA